MRIIELKSGTRKRLHGETRKIADAINWELKVYENRTESALRLRGHSADLLQVYPAGYGRDCGAQALEHGLRVVVNEGMRDHVMDHKELASTVNRTIDIRPILSLSTFPSNTSMRLLTSMSVLWPHWENTWTQLKALS